jgi:hypothetical protein
MVGLQINNVNPNHVHIDPLISGSYEALEKKCRKKFLENKACIWWYALLSAPEWLNMFRYASHRNARENVERFHAWESEYKPLGAYQG